MLSVAWRRTRSSLAIVALATSVSAALPVSASTLQSFTQTRTLTVTPEDGGQLELRDGGASGVFATTQSEVARNQEVNRSATFDNFDPSVGTLDSAEWRFRLDASVDLLTFTRCNGIVGLPVVSCRATSSNNAGLQIDLADALFVGDGGLLSGSRIAGVSMPLLLTSTQATTFSNLTCIGDFFDGVDPVCLDTNRTRDSEIAQITTGALSGYLDQEIRLALVARQRLQSNITCQAFSVLVLCPIDAFAEFNISLSAQLTYFYEPAAPPPPPVPLPAGMVLMLSGVAAFGGLGAWRRSRPAGRSVRSKPVGS